MTEAVTIELSDADATILREWADNAEVPLTALLDQAVRNFIADMRTDHADLEERMKGPFYTIEEVRTHLAERRRLPRVEAAE